MINQENAIEVRNVKKYFKVYYDRGTTLKDKIVSRGRNRYEKREVLKGISFEVKKGEAIGLIGKNGCGKSTTLKLLTKIIYPNEGTVEMAGRVSSLLELGAGFHPDMSGRENIYMNAAVFGLNRKEIDRRVDEIIKFSELEDFIDNPIRTYSSGMYMRLAFSVAINVDADILLIDEILAVGDISFQKKCFEKLKEIKMNGTTIVIVSHSLDQIEKICDRSIWIENGMVREVGKPREVHEQYLYEMEQKRLRKFQEEVYAGITHENNQENVQNGEIPIKSREESQSLMIAEKMKCLRHNLLKENNAIRKGNQKVYFTEMYITDANGEEKLFFETGENINVYLKYCTTQQELMGTICFLIYRDDGVYCYGTNSFIEYREVMILSRISNLKITVNELPLLPGKYYFTLAIHDENAEEYDHFEKAAVFQVLSTKGEQGIVKIETEWNAE